jgi:tRNA dimethylallyltransferase
MQNMLPPAISLMGPTASGKTDLAVRLVQSSVQSLPLEIISVDSALVYRDMNIGTAKPDATVLARAPHHLIDLIEPTEAYSAGRFRTDALRLMGEITARGHVPLLVGGTMLYFKALKDGLDDLPKATPALRAELEARAAQEGWPVLHAELARLDPETAARLNPNDSQRIQRALELCLSTGGTMTALLGQHSAHADEAVLPYNLLQVSLVPTDRAWLHDRINRRFGAMVREGLLDELHALRRQYDLHADLPSMRCVGYRQAWSYLEGDLDMAGLLAQGAAATRQLAKRQLTWLRGWQGAHEVDCMDAPQMEGVLEMVRAHLGR